jgi:hypothetical protein
MENEAMPVVKRKRGRPPLNIALNENSPQWLLKAPQQVDTTKDITTPTEHVSSSVETEKSPLTTVVPEATNESVQDIMTQTISEDCLPVQARDIRLNPMADLTPVDEIVFTSGKNTLKILLSKKHNRMYRVQVFLNDTMEIRPATYTGFSPASTFWGFLKEITK